MKIENPLKMNDWEIKTFLSAILFIQLLVLILVISDSSGSSIPIISQLIPFFYLIFIPGIIILRILRMHQLGNILTPLYAIGLSLSFLMFTGLFVNMIYPIFGITKPISIIPLIVTISLFVFILSILSYIMDKNYSESTKINLKSFISPKIIILSSIPLLAIYGTYLMNYYHTNILQLITILIVSLLVLLIGFDKFIPKKLYPYTIFIISITLLFHTSLISTYIYGYDIMYESYLVNQVIINSIWDYTIPLNYNAMLSIVMIVPILSKLCAINTSWIFKTMYPFIFSLLPLALYKIFIKQTNSKVAFLSVFFFMSFFAFYDEILYLARQQIAEFFLVLMLILIVYKTEDKGKILSTNLLGSGRKAEIFLFILFGISLVVSHYGTSYLYLYIFIAAFLISFLYDVIPIKRITNSYIQKLETYFDNRGIKNRFTSFFFKNINRTEYKKESPRVTLAFIILVSVFATLWFISVTSSSIYNTITHIFFNIIDNLYTNFFQSQSVQGLHVMTTKTTHGFLGKINTVINYLNQIFIIIGLISVIIFNWASNRAYNFNREYRIISVINLSLLFAAITIPFFADELNMSRIYHLTLLTLAPFCIIGAMYVLMFLRKVLRIDWTTKKSIKISYGIIALFLVIFFLYQSSFVYQTTEGSSYSIAIDKNIDSAVYNNQEVIGADWFSKYKVINPFYSDYYGGFLLVSITGRDPIYMDPQHMLITNNSYAYLRKFNIENKSWYISYKEKAVLTDYYINITDVIRYKSLVYSNGNSQIYFS